MKFGLREEIYNLIKEVVKNNYNNTVKFVDYAEAKEYRDSLKMK